MGEVANARILLKSSADSSGIVVEKYPDIQPEFPGDIRAYLAEHLSYPERLRDSAIVDRVVFQFIVGADGRVVSARLKKSSGDTAWDSSIVSMLLAMPRWKPAIKNGKPVAVAFSLPVHITPDW